MPSSSSTLWGDRVEGRAWGCPGRKLLLALANRSIPKGHPRGVWRLLLLPRASAAPGRALLPPCLRPRRNRGGVEQAAPHCSPRAELCTRLLQGSCPHPTLPIPGQSNLGMAKGCSQTRDKEAGGGGSPRSRREIEGKGFAEFPLGTPGTTTWGRTLAEGEGAGWTLHGEDRETAREGCRPKTSIFTTNFTPLKPFREGLGSGLRGHPSA